MDIITVENPNPHSLLAFESARPISGHTVSVASIKNDRERNDDRVAVIGLEDVPPLRLPFLVNEAMQQAEKYVRQLSPREKRSSSTATIVAYDPKDYTLAVRSRGDSPAYIVLHDKDKAVAIRITSPLDGVGNMVINSLMPNHVERYPAHGAIYSFVPDPENRAYVYDARKIQYPAAKEKIRVPLDIDKLIGEATAHLGLQNDVQATLVVTSDGLEKGFKIKQGVVNDAFAKRVAELVRSGEQHPAMVLANENATAHREATGDNTTLVVMPLKKGQGKPIATMVADGYDYPGGRYAQTGLEGFLTVMKVAQHEAHEQQQKLEKKRKRQEELDNSSSERDTIFGAEMRGGAPIETFAERRIREGLEASPKRGK